MDIVNFVLAFQQVVISVNSLSAKLLEICKQTTIIFKPCRSMNDLTAVCKYS